MSDDGGPAFPFSVDVECGGMSLRDWFAGLAMQACFTGAAAQILANVDRRFNGTNFREVVALNAYEMADAMLEARK